MIIEHSGIITESLSVCGSPKSLFSQKPDLLIADFTSLAEIAPGELIRNNIKTLLIGSSCLPETRNHLVANNIGGSLAGILPPTANSTQLKKAVRKVSAGELWIDRRQFAEIVSELRTHNVQPPPPLTPREQQIIRLVYQGQKNKEIMAALNISEQCVKSHLNRIYKKTGVSGRLNLALLASRQWPHLFVQL